tara:strand:+ start:3077 stop:3775 length:699 start_codon:yes stop_codon:yes gene_type:complete
MKKALLILHQKRSQPGDIGEKLIERGYELDIRKPCAGDKLPDNLNEHALVVIFGGPMSVNDDNIDFIQYEMKWLKVVIESGKPFLGICLGAQMLAKYLGGDVKKIDCNSSEIGFYEILPSDSSTNIFNEQKIFFQWHSEGFNLPKDSTLLASGNKFKVQAFKHANCYAIQFHPEVNFKLHLRWLYFVLLSNPGRLFVKGSQNLLFQMFLRIKYNSKISKWLDNFLDKHFLKT